jgi:hypothetical protein
MQHGPTTVEPITTRPSMMICPLIDTKSRFGLSFAQGFPKASFLPQQEGSERTPCVSCAFCRSEQSGANRRLVVKRQTCQREGLCGQLRMPDQFARQSGKFWWLQTFTLL